MTCSCGKIMRCIGNVSGFVFTSNPPRWFDTWICDDCKTRKTVQQSYHVNTPIDLRGYKELK